MKLIYIVLIILMAELIQSNNNTRDLYNSKQFECIEFACLHHHVCAVYDNGVNKCVEPFGSKELFKNIMVQQTVKNRWSNSNLQDPKVQVSVDIINNMEKKIIHGLIIFSATKFNECWNIVRNTSIYQIPSYAKIYPNQTYNFGYIIDGYEAVRLYLGSVYVE